jgi:hypothetical protein
MNECYWVYWQSYTSFHIENVPTRYEQNVQNSYKTSIQLNHIGCPAVGQLFMLSKSDVP